MNGQLLRNRTISALITVFFSVSAFSQNPDTNDKNALSQRTRVAPGSVFSMFRDAGMNPVNHPLTPVQQQKVNHAFALLPPLHQRILKQHLHSISFMDNMPNTALTSPVDSGGITKMFNITFRAGLLNETISEWATWKEATCFSSEADSTFSVRVEGGNLDAIIYVLLHEATHIVDAVTEITPHFTENQPTVTHTRFTKGIWQTTNKPEGRYRDPLLEQTRFRSGRPMPISRAPEVYQKLAKTPFASLYGMAAWSEDIAELATIYHLTTRLKQPFQVIVSKNNVGISRFEPMKNRLVRQRLAQLATFYAR